MTLIELVVVLAILGVLATVAGTALPSSLSRDTATSPQEALAAQIATLRDSALTSGQIVTAAITVRGRTEIVTAHPDGQIVSAGGEVERVTGRVNGSR